MKQCPNTDCDNSHLYDDDDEIEFCPICQTALEDVEYLYEDSDFPEEFEDTDLNEEDGEDTQ